MRLRSFTVVAVVAVIATTVVASPMQARAVTVAPLLDNYDGENIDDNYIVVLKDSAHPAKQRLDGHFSWLTADIERANARAPAYRDSNRVSHVYGNTVVGYAGRFEPEVLERIRSSDDVAYVERDSVVYTQETQHGAPWGLARISHRKPLGFGTFNKYIHDAEAGAGVTVYVVDTGINVDHVDFDGRARWGKTVPLNDVDEDKNGHGTHVAGTIAGKRYGVAKSAEVVAVKVLGSNGSGSMSDVVMGVEYTVKEHRKAAAKASREGKAHASVANMSLGGGFSRALNLAVDAAVRSGVHYAVAAGNDNRDACGYSPASSPNAITVGATTIVDERAWFSNYGKCVDVFAPGKDILSTWIGGKTRTNTISGTSMASPHVAGLAAYLLSQEKSISLSGAELKSRMIELATKDAVEDPGEDSPNVLIYNDPPSA
ncbi:proteinase B [Coemansia sp. RSA 552]|nr:proteinase B [Coemansia sp. RSA 552]